MHTPAGQGSYWHPEPATPSRAGGTLGEGMPARAPRGAPGRTPCCSTRVLHQGSGNTKPQVEAGQRKDWKQS